MSPEFEFYAAIALWSLAGLFLSCIVGIIISEALHRNDPDYISEKEFSRLLSRYDEKRKTKE